MKHGGKYIKRKIKRTRKAKRNSLQSYKKLITVNRNQGGLTIEFKFGFN